MEKLRHYINSISSLDENEWNLFQSRIERIEYSKKSTILKEGKVENYINFVEEGILRYYIPQLDNDLTFGFCFEDDLASAYDSFLTQTPSKYQIEALTKTTIWRISYSSLNEIYTLSRYGSDIGRKLGERLFIKSLERELSLLGESAQERYMKLFESRPNMIKLIPLKYIASYIGITPQALSRIRSQIS